MVRITAAGRRTRKLLDELMRSRTQQIIDSIPPKQRAASSATRSNYSTTQSKRAGCCALNAPVATLSPIKEQK